MKIIYSAVFVNKDKLIEKYPPKFPNVFSHHSTIEFKPKSIDDIPIGGLIQLPITGRLTTRKVDALLVDNKLSKNAYPHITLSTADGVKPFESNAEIANNLDTIHPIDDMIEGVYGVNDGKQDIITPEIKVIDDKDNINDLMNKVQKF